MRAYVNGELVDLEDDNGAVDAEELYRRAQAGPGRVLVVQRPGGRNLALPRSGPVTLNPEDSVLSLFTGRRGTR